MEPQSGFTSRPSAPTGQRVFGLLVETLSGIVPLVMFGTEIDAPNTRLRSRNRRCRISKCEECREEGQAERGLICTDAALGGRCHTLDLWREARERVRIFARPPRGFSFSPLPIVLSLPLPLLQDTSMLVIGYSPLCPTPFTKSMGAKRRIHAENHLSLSVDPSS